MGEYLLREGSDIEDVKTGINLCTKAAGINCSEAALALGKYYLKSPETSLEQARYWLKQAAIADDEARQILNQIGTGDGDHFDEDKWAANLRENIALLILKSSMPREEKIQELESRVNKIKNPKIYYQLGLLYFEGEANEQNLNNAKINFRKAKAAGIEGADEMLKKVNEMARERKSGKK